MYQTTSRSAYEAVAPFLGLKQKEVYEAFQKLGPSTNREIAEYLHWEINRVTPRVNELVSLRQLVEYERRRCTVTGFSAIAWDITKDTLF